MLPGMTPFVPQLELVKKTIVLSLTGAGVWTVPNDWNPSQNKIECIGAGASGVRCANTTSAGGGAGGYSASENVFLVPGASVDYNVGAGGIGTTANSSGVAGGPTWFGHVDYASAIVGAKNGNGGSGTTGGTGALASDGIGQTRFGGGNGGNAAGGVAGGGGGAGGPNGDGQNASGGTGGAGDAGSGGAGGLTGQATFNATDGRVGRNLDGQIGAGGGAGGPNNVFNFKGRTGGMYGAGGGGARSGSTFAGGDGAQGVIIITYWGLPGLILPQTKFVNDFGQYPTGVAPADWTDQTLAGGFTWSVESVAGTVSGKALRVLKSANVRRILTWDKLPLVEDGEVLIRARSIEGGAPAGSTMVASIMRCTQTNPSSTFYFATAHTAASGTRWAQQLTKVVSGTQTVIGSVASGPTPNYATNDWFYIRARLFGSDFRARLFRPGTIEPTTWLPAGTDSGITGNGLWGILPGGDAPDVEIDYFALDTSGAVIPVPI